MKTTPALKYVSHFLRAEIATPDSAKSLLLSDDARDRVLTYLCNNRSIFQYALLMPQFSPADAAGTLTYTMKYSFEDVWSFYMNNPIISKLIKKINIQTFAHDHRRVVIRHNLGGGTMLFYNSATASNDYTSEVLITINSLYLTGDDIRDAILQEGASSDLAKHPLEIVCTYIDVCAAQRRYVPHPSKIWQCKIPPEHVSICPPLLREVAIENFNRQLILTRHTEYHGARNYIVNRINNDFYLLEKIYDSVGNKEYFFDKNGCPIWGCNQYVNI